MELGLVEKNVEAATDDEWKHAIKKIRCVIVEKRGQDNQQCKKLVIMDLRCLCGAQEVASSDSGRRSSVASALAEVRSSLACSLVARARVKFVPRGGNGPLSRRIHSRSSKKQALV